MHNTIEIGDNAAYEELTAPDRFVIAETCAIEADADHTGIPRLTFGEHGSDGILQGRADSEHRLRTGYSSDRTRRVTARSSQNGGSERSGANNGIVNSTRNRPLADQKCIGYAGEAFKRIGIEVRNRFTRAIRTCHDEDIRCAGRK